MIARVLKSRIIHTVDTTVQLLEPLSEEFLARHLEAKTGGSNVNTTANKGSESDAGHSPELVQVLREQLVQAQLQLKVKDDQIAWLSEITKSLNDRLREGNILMGSLQQQFALIMLRTAEVLG